MVKEFKKTVFKFKIYGDDFEVTAPNMRQVEDFQAKIDKGDKSEVALSIDFLGALGVNNDKAWQLEPTHLKEIIETVCAQKK